jgi:hypothetical protein
LLYEGTGFATEPAALVTVLNESTESRIVTLKCVELVDPAQWTNNTPFFEVDITTGTGSVRMRIDANTDLFGTEPPVGVFGVTGIADQRDFDEPFTSGYRISPRNQDDITTPVNAYFTLPSPWNPNDGPLGIQNLSEGAGGYYWSFGNGDNSQDETPVYSYPEDGTYTIILTASSLDGNCNDQHISEVEVITVSVEEVDGAWALVQLFPNPTTSGSDLTIRTDAAGGLQSWRAFDLSGREVANDESLRGATEIRVNTSEWAAGLHTFRITTTAGFTTTARVVVGH